MGETAPLPSFIAESNNVLLSGLNPQQSRAVTTLDGPLLVLAGAGTGKTRVLTTRLGYILQQAKAFPQQILAVTFTNKASQEMRERVSTLLGQPVDQMWLGTFHALGLRILRRHFELVGLRSNFTILDTDDQLRLIKQILKARNIDEKQTPAKSFLSTISRWKDRALSPDRIPSAESTPLVSEVYQAYQTRLIELNAVDFGDLLFHVITIFQKNPTILHQYQQQFHYILVDEYQDTNIAQYLWLRLLAQGHNNLCCVGDDDQSIYGWRGAEVGNILRFEKDFPGADIIKLEQNYRSTTHILGAASGLISHNRSRHGKTLWTEKDGGDKVLIRGTWDGQDEARIVSEAIEQIHRDNPGDVLRHIAILVRASFQTREFEERFLKAGIPYKVIGGLRFYERLEIRDAIAYMRLLMHFDDDLAFERILAKPKRGIGTVTIRELYTRARAAGTSMMHAAKLYAYESEKGQARKTLQQLFEALARWQEKLNHHNHSEVVQMMLDESGYTGMWQQDKSPEAPGRLENLKELITALKEFDTLAEFLDHVSLVMENSQNSDYEVVSLMTLHTAKGLEFDYVFLPGWEEGLFPHPRCLHESGQQGLEEERRLAYVGISRAKKQGMITYSLQRYSVYNGWQSNVPSRFIKELPSEHIIHRQANADGFNKFQGFNNKFANPGLTVRNQHPRTIISTAEYKEPPASDHNFSQGDRVFHEKFGYGSIEGVWGDHIEVIFEHSGFKKINANFLKKK